MDLVSVCRLPVASTEWMPREGAHAFTVVAKATFELAKGKLDLADVQEDIQHVDRHWNDEQSNSVYAPSDLAPFKPRADVIVVGEAFAPDGAATRSLVARVQIGTIDKSLEIIGDRHLDDKDELVEGEPFTRLALRYERAESGPANPVGRSDERDLYGRRHLPNLVKPGTVDGDPLDSVGFGPLAATWSVRRILLGRHAVDWAESAWAATPMPTDINGAFFQAAPPDQRLDELPNDVSLTLENLFAGEPKLACRLPGLEPVAYVETGGGVRELKLRADTLWIDTTRKLLTGTWRGRVDLTRPDENGRVFISIQKAGDKVTWAQIESLTGTHQIIDDQTHEGSTTDDPGLPFRDGNGLLDEHTAVGATLLQGMKGELPDWLDEAQQGSTSRIPTRSMKQALHRNDQSPGWLRGSRPPSDSVTDADPLNTTMGYGTQRSWTPGTGPVQAGSRSAPRPPPPPPPGNPVLVDPASSGTVPGISVPLVAPSAPPPMSPAPIASVNVRPPNPVEAMQQRARAESYSEPTPGPMHDRMARPVASEIVEMLWYEPECIDKVHQKSEWTELFEVSDEKEDEDEPFDFDEEPPAAEDPAVRDRRHIVAVMTRGHITTGASLHHAMGEAVDVTGNFEPPLVIMTGRLHFPFDELKTLKATLAAVTPLIAGNSELAETVGAVNELMQTPWLEAGSSDVADKLTDRVRQAFKRADRLMDPSYLDDHTERILLEQRCYSMRPVFGEDHIRAVLMPSSSKTRIPVYLPASLQKELPMFQSIPARILAEAHVAQDQFESHDCALKVVALGRVVQLARPPF